MNIKTISAIALKNLRRHARRTVLNMISIGISVGVLFFFIGYYRGTYIVMMREAYLKYKTSHVQIQTKSFNEKRIQDYVTKDTVIHGYESIIAKIKKNQYVVSASGRLINTGFAGNGQEKMVVSIVGCNPETEKDISVVDDFTKEGTFLDKNDGILIGAKTAELFGLKLGGLCFLQAQTINNAPNVIQLPVTGIYNTGFYELDKNTVYISLKSANGLFDTGDAINKIFIFLKDMELSKKTAQQLSGIIGTNLEAKPWEDYSQAILENEKGDSIFYAIFVLILLFIGISTIMGTMYVNVFERIREIGMLRAIGWQQNEIFRLFLIESICIGILGSAFGILIIGGIPTFYLAHYGIDYSQMGELIAIPVFKLISKPELLDVIVCFAVGMISTYIGGYLPSRKASRMVITDALRTN